MWSHLICWVSHHMHELKNILLWRVVPRCIVRATVLWQRKATTNTPSCHLVTINTYKGLFECMHLPFSIIDFSTYNGKSPSGHSTSCVYLNNIRVTGMTEQEHLTNLPCINCYVNLRGGNGDHSWERLLACQGITQVKYGPHTTMISFHYFL